MCRDIWYPMAQLFTIQEENEGEKWKRRKLSKNFSYYGKENWMFFYFFIIVLFSACVAFSLLLTLREKRLSWKNHSRRNPFVFLSFIFEFISLRGPYRRLEPTGREFPRSSCARGIHSVAAAKEFLIYVGLKHTHTRVQKTHVFYPPNTTFPLNFKFTFLALKWL